MPPDGYNGGADEYNGGADEYHRGANEYHDSDVGAVTDDEYHGGATKYGTDDDEYDGEEYGADDEYHGSTATVRGGSARGLCTASRSAGATRAAARHGPSHRHPGVGRSCARVRRRGATHLLQSCRPPPGAARAAMIALPCRPCGHIVAVAVTSVTVTLDPFRGVISLSAVCPRCGNPTAGLSSVSDDVADRLADCGAMTAIVGLEHPTMLLALQILEDDDLFEDELVAFDLTPAEAAPAALPPLDAAPEPALPPEKPWERLLAVLESLPSLERES